MITAITLGREALLALADEIETSDGLYRLDSKLGEHQGYQLGIKKTAQIVAALRLAAKPADEGMYLVWSNWHRAWWCPNSHGYTDNVKSAGRYSRAEAISISFQGRDGWDSPKGVPDELAIAERDVPVFTASKP